MVCIKCGTPIREGAKFCSKCGTPVGIRPRESTTGKKPVKPSAKPVMREKPLWSGGPDREQPEKWKQHKKNKKRSKKPVIISLACTFVAAAVFIVIAFVFHLLPGQGNEETDLGLADTAKALERYIPVSPETGMVVETPEDAKEALASLQTEIGFGSLDEFGEPEEKHADVIGSFRFTQEIDNIPVEGSEIRLITDGSRQVIGVVGSYLDPESVTTDSNVSEQDAAVSVEKVCAEDADIIPTGQVILRKEDTGEAAWRFWVSDFDDTRIYYVSSGSGEILDNVSMQNTDYALGRGESDKEGEGEVTFLTNETEDTYRMENLERRFRMHDLNEKKTELKFVFRESMEASDYYMLALNDESRPRENKPGEYILHKNGKEIRGHEYSFKAPRYILDNGEIIIDTIITEILFEAEDSSDDIGVLTDSDNNWDNRKAVGLTARMEETDRFYNNVLLRDGVGDDQISFLNLGVNGKVSGGAKSSSVSLCPGVKFACIRFSTQFDSVLDVLTHEFTHAVLNTSFTILGCSYTYAEAAALNEGLADIMGECCEVYITDTSDWTHYNVRNMADPESKEDNGLPYPSRYRGEGWYTKTDTKDERDYFGHHNSTVISHLGYLIATGNLKDASDTEALGAETLARLLYNSFHFLEEDTDFRSYATFLYRTAIAMYDTGELTEAQVYCVYKALIECNLVPVFLISNDTDTAKLFMMDLNGKSLKDYHIRLATLTKSSDKPSDSHTETNSSNDQPDTHTETNSSDVQLNLHTGSNSVFEDDVKDQKDYEIDWPGRRFSSPVWGYKVVLTQIGEENRKFEFYLKCTEKGDITTITTPFVVNEEPAGEISGDYREEDLFHYGIIPAESSSNGLWGYMDKNGRWAIEPQYGYALGFNAEGRALVEYADSEYYTYINLDNEILVDRSIQFKPYNYYDCVDPTIVSVTLVENGEKQPAYVYFENDEFQIMRGSDIAPDLMWMTNFSTRGYAILERNDGKNGIINRRFELLLDPAESEYYALSINPYSNILVNYHNSDKIVDGSAFGMDNSPVGGWNDYVVLNGDIYYRDGSLYMKRLDLANVSDYSGFIGGVQENGWIHVSTGAEGFNIYDLNTKTLVFADNMHIYNSSIRYDPGTFKNGIYIGSFFVETDENGNAIGVAGLNGDIPEDDTLAKTIVINDKLEFLYYPFTKRLDMRSVYFTDGYAVAVDRDEGYWVVVDQDGNRLFDNPDVDRIEFSSRKSPFYSH